MLIPVELVVLLIAEGFFLGRSQSVNWSQVALNFLQTVSTSSANSVTQSPNSTTAAVPTSYGAWPACPLKGCLPCPSFADGRPDCACLEGYTRTGQPLPGPVGIRDLLVWDQVQGWIGRCLSVDCGYPPTITRASQINASSKPMKLRFPQDARYVCDTGYFVDGFVFPPKVTASGILIPPQLSPEGYDMSRIIAINCSANGSQVSNEQQLCVPTCGDGRLMPTDHLPMYDPREQCDDGNLANGDGCSQICGVESGYVCTGGSPTSADVCKKTEVAAGSSVVLSLSGRRKPSTQEISNASGLAMAIALGCAWRDVEIHSVQTADLNTTAGVASTGGGPSKFHSNRMTVAISFTVKVSDPGVLSIDKIKGDLTSKTGLEPKLWVAFNDFTSLKDMYVTIVSFGAVSVTGDESKGRPEDVSITKELKQWVINFIPVYSYFFLIGIVFPVLVWLVRVRPRRYTLHGRYGDVLDEYKGSWAANICTCMGHKCLLFSLLCCLPARLAETWDSVGSMPYWAGVRRATCCCFLYLTVICAPCGAAIAGHQRSNIRDYFGFGDDIEGNIEFADICCYLCCPVCCVVQEARHVDRALRFLPPPAEDPDWMQDFEEDEKHHHHHGHEHHYEKEPSQEMLPVSDDLESRDPQPSRISDT